MATAKEVAAAARDKGGTPMMPSSKGYKGGPPSGGAGKGSVGPKSIKAHSDVVASNMGHNYK